MFSIIFPKKKGIFMNFITSYYWQQGEGVPNATSLLLQQFSCEKRGRSIVFGCVCEGSKADDTSGIASGYMTERLQVWLYEEALAKCRNAQGRKLPTLGEGVRRTIWQTDGELGGICSSVCGLLCIDKRFLFFYRGQSELYLLNSRFGRANLTRLSARTEGIVLQWGEIQKGAGILLATHDFCQGVGEQSVRECLAVKEIDTKERADKRLKELGCEAERRKVRNAGAILVLAG